jgi:hypothetical protein
MGERFSKARQALDDSRRGYSHQEKAGVNQVEVIGE